MKSHLRYSVLIVAFFVMGMLGCSSAPSTPAAGGRSGKILVVATLFPLADWLREIAGPDADVYCLISGSANAHHFEPSIKDVTTVTRATAVFAVGLELDPWAAKLVANANAKTRFFETGKWILPRRLTATQTISVSEPGKAAAKADHEGHHHDDGHDHHHGDSDPHFWLDPSRAADVVQRMADELTTLDPAHADGYKKRSEAYIASLKALSAELDSQAKSVPPGTKIVTFHDAYGYLLERLNIKLVAVVQVSPGVEPSPKNVSEAIRAMKDIKQRTVFSEPTGSPAAAKIVAREIGGAIETLDPMDSEMSTVGRTYLERMRHNISVLVKMAKP